MPSTSLRLVTVPDTAPPYDCDAHGAACPAGRDLAGRDAAGSRPAGVDPLGAGQAPGSARIARAQPGRCSSLR